MERTEPLNPERRVNLLLRIWLFPMASAFKITKAIPSATSYRKNYHDRSFAFAWLIATEFFILLYLWPQIDSINLNRAIVLIALFQGIPEFAFYKKTNELAFNYYAYYPKVLLYVFFVFLMIGLVLIGRSLYNDIGTGR